MASVQANSVPISGDMKAGTATVHHRGGCLEGEFAENWPYGALCRARSARKAISPPDRRPAAPIKPLRGPSSDGVLAGDVDRLFISGLAVVEILHANRARPQAFCIFPHEGPRAGFTAPHGGGSVL